MAKKNQKYSKPVKKEDDRVLLQDHLKGDLFEKLKEKQRSLKDEEKRKQEEVLLKKQEEARLREKNKSFEELLNESSVDWTKFK